MKYLFILGFLMCCLAPISGQMYQNDEVTIEEETPSNNGIEEEKTQQTHQEYIDSIAQNENIEPTSSDDWDQSKIKRDYSENKKKEEEKKNENVNTNWEFNFEWMKLSGVKYVLFTLVGVLILLFLWILAKNTTINSKFQSIRSGMGFQIIDEATGFSGNFRTKYLKAEAEGLWADAVRFRYLANLQDLQLLHWIDYRKHKTNAHYVSELVAKSIDRPFYKTAHWFELVRYGEWAPDQETYQKIHLEFQHFEALIPKQNNA